MLLSADHEEIQDLAAVDALRAGRREWIGLAVLALPCLLYAMDLSVLNLAVPALSADLRPSSTQLLWIVDIYGFIVAGSLVTMGTLGRPHRPPPAAAGRHGVWCRLGAGRLCDQPGAADRGPGAAGGGRGDPGPLDAVADPQHVRRPPPAHRRDLGVGDQLLGGWCDRAAAWRGAAGMVLVGVGVAACGGGGGASAGAGAGAAAGVSGSQRGPAGPAQRRDVAGWGAAGHLGGSSSSSRTALAGRRRCRWWRGWRSGWCSCAGSAR